MLELKLKREDVNIYLSIRFSIPGEAANYVLSNKFDVVKVTASMAEVVAFTRDYFEMGGYPNGMVCKII